MEIIGQHAFSGCSGLSSITISNSVINIGDGGFFDCNGLSSITILSHDYKIESDIFGSYGTITKFKNPVVIVKGYRNSGVQELVDEINSKYTDTVFEFVALDEVDKGALEELYQSCQEKEKGDYTKESWNDFQAAMGEAKKVLDDEKATQEEVEKALVELEAACEALELKPTPAPKKEQVIAYTKKYSKPLSAKSFKLKAKVTVGNGAVLSKVS